MPRPELDRRAVIAALAGLLAPLPAAAMLDRPARLVTGAGPGSGTDSVVRLLAQELSGSYAVQVVADNRPGAVTRLAVEHVKAAAPDGLTLLYVPMPVMSLFPHVYPRTTRYTPLVDFAPVATLGELPFGLAVRADHPARDLAEFLDWARAQPAVDFFAALGAPQHLYALELARQARFAPSLVSYRNGLGGAMPDLLAGRLGMIFSHMGDLAPPTRDGRTRLLAVTAPRRLPAFPETPSFAEAGFAGIEGTEAVCVLLPALTPAILVGQLHAALARALSAEAVRERLTRLDITPLLLPPAATAARIAAESAAWAGVVRQLGFSAET